MSTEQPSASDRAAATADGSWMLWTTIGLGGLWVAVLLISLFSPDLVSGSEQEHLPLAAFITWLWGLFATAAFVWSMGRLRGSADRRTVWIGYAVTVLVVWGIATVLCIVLPVFETGSDPTQLPMGALVAPVAAMVLTTVAGVVAGVFGRPPEAG